MYPTNTLSDKIFGISNPNYVRDMFNKYCQENKIEIAQNKTVADHVQALNGVLVGNTVVNFTANAPFSSSTTNLTYPESEHFFIVAMRGFQGASATLAQTDWVAGWGDALSMNGNFTVLNNGTQVEKNIPFTVFQEGANWPEAGWFALSKPTMLIGQTDLQIQGTWAAATATANLNGRIELWGVKLI